ncbi:MAG: hypothetical protein ABIO78_06410 [Thermoanaerobaculia bacterium]
MAGWPGARGIAQTAQVRRSGAVVKVPAEEVVPGDIVLLGAGDRVPADLPVIEAAAPPASEWLLLAVTIVLPIAIVETQKTIARRRAAPTPAIK